MTKKELIEILKDVPDDFEIIMFDENFCENFRVTENFEVLEARKEVFFTIKEI